MQKQKFRVTMDFPIEVHTHLKMKAAQKKVSMTDLVLEALANQEALDEKMSMDLDESTFRKAFNEIKKEKKALAKALSNI